MIFNYLKRFVNSLTFEQKTYLIMSEKLLNNEALNHNEAYLIAIKEAIDDKNVIFSLKRLINFDSLSRL
jgi:hypothetical protein